MKMLRKFDSRCQFKSFAITILLSCFFCLASCGFHLRGQPPLAPSLKYLYIQTKDPYGQLTKYLKQYLKMSGVAVVDSSSEASTTLEILSEHQADQLQSV